MHTAFGDSNLANRHLSCMSECFQRTDLENILCKIFPSLKCEKITDASASINLVYCASSSIIDNVAYFEERSIDLYPFTMRFSRFCHIKRTEKA